MYQCTTIDYNLYAINRKITYLYLSTYLSHTFQLQRTYKYMENREIKTTQDNITNRTLY